MLLQVASLSQSARDKFADENENQEQAVWLAMDKHVQGDHEFQSLQLLVYCSRLKH